MDTLRRSKRATMARSNLKEGSPSAAAPGQRGASPRWRGGGGFLRARRDVHADPLVALREEKRSWDGCSARCRSRRSRSPTSGARCGPGSAPACNHPRKLFRLMTHSWRLVRSLGELGKSVFHIGRGAAHIEMLHCHRSRASERSVRRPHFVPLLDAMFRPSIGARHSVR